ncbi:hypothetical protein [Amycolatopsis alba]|uniref:Uncharacterized protein n=1 Tax=Amycolatopsis alba DSM 44262 TaxID=1125972 RepID=A0A229S6B4_AMYAL|nr:hypothetical protein [Amycolatopsis alba]OXM54477.1 hypothetical protein CFP75_05255 [Amycolatopsis alba DSM 44262]
MSPNWSPLLIVAVFAAMGWGPARPGLARAGRCAATMLLAWWVAMIQTWAAVRVLREIGAPHGGVRMAAVGLRAPGVALTVVLASQQAQGVE